MALTVNLCVHTLSQEVIVMATREGPTVDSLRGSESTTSIESLDRVEERLNELHQKIVALQVWQTEQTHSKASSNSLDGVNVTNGLQKGTDPSETGKDSKEAPRDKWKVNLGGHIQLDFVTWANATDSIPNTENYANFRRLRLVADGEGYESYDFRLQLTLEPDSEVPSGLTATGLIKDAYFSLNDIPGIGRFRIGHFFVPFSLEQVTNDTNNIFLERSIPTQTVFAADRELGMAIYNCTEGKRIHWASGVFIDSVNEGPKKRLDDNQGYRLSGRLTCLPYYDDPSDGRYLIHTGVGLLHTDDHDNVVRFRSRPQISEGPRIIDSGALFADKYTTGNLETAIVWERFAVQSEAFLSSVDLIDGPTTLANGAYIYLSWFLTGESRNYEPFGQHGAQFGRNKPFRNFSAKRPSHQPGAWELKIRWSHLDLNQFERGQYNDLSFGCNWYWSDRVRWMFDWIHPYTSDTAIFGKTESDILGMRWDVNW